MVAILEPMLMDEKRIRTGLKLGFHSSISNADQGGKIWVFASSFLSIQVMGLQTKCCLWLWEFLG
ncbi:hypothetical protein PJP07_30830, partial [Mycobacterium kansasii]